MAGAAVVVLNADLDVLHRVSLHKAIRMLFRQVAVIHEEVPGRRIGPYPMPRVLRLITYVVTKWRYTRGPTWSKHGVLVRDGRRCGYCNATATTIDHVHPASRGGTNAWTNTVACCLGCNQKKGDRTPTEAGMTLRITPAAPSWRQVVADRPA